MTNCVLFFLIHLTPASALIFSSVFFVFLEMALPALSAWCLTHAYKHVHALRLGDSCYCAQPQGSISKTAQGITLPTACRKEERNIQTGI